jgi:PleD family two-component response regulator
LDDAASGAVTKRGAASSEHDWIQGAGDRRQQHDPAQCEIFLKQGGHDVLLAEDGFDALAKVNDYQPNLIFCDILMPRLDGLPNLRDHQAQRQIRFVPW